MKVDIEQYSNFVADVTSKQSNYMMEFGERLQDLSVNTDVNIPLLITGSIGLSAESGEVTEVVKKVLFQGKPLDADTKYHLKRELGDVAWYLINTCRALNITFDEVLEENIKKLEARYPNGFEAAKSENRKKGDI